MSDFEQFRSYPPIEPVAGDTLPTDEDLYSHDKLLKMAKNTNINMIEPGDTQNSWSDGLGSTAIAKSLELEDAEVINTLADTFREDVLRQLSNILDEANGNNLEAAKQLLKKLLDNDNFYVFLEIVLSKPLIEKLTLATEEPNDDALTLQNLLTPAIELVRESVKNGKKISADTKNQRRIIDSYIEHDLNEAERREKNLPPISNN